MIDLSGMSELMTTPTIRPDVAAALKIAKDNLPAYPTELLTKLGAYVGEGPWAKQEKPQFREWIWKIGDCWNGDLPYNVSCNLADGYWRDDINLSDIGYIGVWRGRTASATHFIYCVLPSMGHGEVKAGETFNVGGEPIRIGWKQEELDAMVEEGYKIMMAMIAEHGEYRGEKNEKAER